MFTLDTFFFNSSFMCQARTIFPLSIPYFCLIIKINRRTMTKIKEEHSFQRVRLMKQAAAIRQNNGMNRHDALVTAHRIGALIRQMHHGNVRFHYTKQDGSVRHAIGTLTGYEHSFHQPYIPRPENTFVVYYDIEAKDGARSMRKTFWTSTPRTNPKRREQNEPAGTRRMGNPLQAVQCRLPARSHSRLPGRIGVSYPLRRKARTPHGGGRNAV